jgi:hypothetical protein
MFCSENCYIGVRRVAGFFQNLSRNDTADSDLPAASLFTILPPLNNDLIPGSRVLEVKLNFTLEQATKAQTGSRGIAVLFL